MLYHAEPKDLSPGFAVPSPKGRGTRGGSALGKQTGRSFNHSLPSGEGTAKPGERSPGYT